jgi:mono/diheme cytochrome c family protein
MKSMMSLTRTFILGACGLFVFANGAWAADPFNGARIYNKHCASCHGANGRAIMAATPDFKAGAPTFLKTDKQLLDIIKNGKSIMPGYQGMLTENEMLDSIAHIRTFF